METKKLKVLLVDDEKEFVESLSERLELRDLDAEIAYDGVQALQALKDGDPDVMVLDLRMPGIDGIEVLRSVKKNHPNISVVILTGHGTDRDEREARRLGASAYLKKPIDIELLVRTLHNVWTRLKKSKKAVDNLIMAAAFSEAGHDEIAREAINDLMNDSNKDKIKA